MRRAFNILLVGSPGSGKTTYLNRLAERDHTVTGLAHRYEGPIVFFSSNVGPFHFPMREVEDRLEPYDDCAHGAIIMFDLSSAASFHAARGWKELLAGTHPEVPTVLCGNKMDLQHTAIPIREALQLQCPYHDLSVVANYNLASPFLSLARIFTRSRTLTFH